MSFIKSKSDDKFTDDTRHLLCTAPGCGRNWSVNLGSPKCSLHQWGPNRIFGFSDNQKPDDKYLGDPKGWAKRIIDKSKAGLQVNPTTLKLANDALRIRS